MRILNEELLNTSNTAIGVSAIQPIEHMGGYAIHAKITDKTLGTKTFDSAIAASKEIQGMTYSAKTPGPESNDISIEYIADGTAGAETVDVTEYEIVVHMEDTPAVAATKTMQGMLYSSKSAGIAGNSITIAITGGATAGSEVVTVVDSAISVQIEDGVSTDTQVKTAIDAKVEAAALITVTGDTGAAQTTQIATALEGGTDRVQSTDTQIKTAIEAEAGADALVALTGNTGAAQTVQAHTRLEGGVTSTINLESNNITLTAHGYAIGAKTRLTTDGALPTGLAAGTDYYIIVVDANTLAFATSLANAQAGTKINITADGSGTHTITSTTLSGTIKLQASIDGANYIDVDSSSANITETTEKLYNIADAFYPYVKILLTLTAGSVDAYAVINAKGF